MTIVIAELLGSRRFGFARPTRSHALRRADGPRAEVVRHLEERFLTGLRRLKLLEQTIEKISLTFVPGRIEEDESAAILADVAHRPSKLERLDVPRALLRGAL